MHIRDSAGAEVIVKSLKPLIQHVKEQRRPSTGECALKSRDDSMKKTIDYSPGNLYSSTRRKDSV